MKNFVDFKNSWNEHVYISLRLIYQMANYGKIAGTIVGAVIGQAVGKKYGFIPGALTGLAAGHFIDLFLESNENN